jgi:hypothetical protein
LTTDRDRREDTLRAFLEDGASTLPDHVLDAVLDRLAVTPQRSAAWHGWLSAAAPLVWGSVVAAALVVAMLAGDALLRPPPVGEPPASPMATPLTVNLQRSVELPAGRYAVPPPYPSGISFEVPSGWSSCSQSRYEQGVCLTAAGNPPIAVSFLIVENVMADPCDDPPDPPVGPGLDDLATAIASMKDFAATSIERLTVDGHDARELTVTAPARGTCGLPTWITPTRTNRVGGGEANLVRIIDVDGVRFVMAGAYFPLDNREMRAEAQVAMIRSIFDSVRIGS